MSSTLTFPICLFESKNLFNDYDAPDMRYGDLSEARLRHDFELINISNVVDPYTLERLSAFGNPQSRFNGVFSTREKDIIDKNACANLMFDELRATSLPFSLYGPYRHLINMMLTHLQSNTGTPFSHSLLNQAYKKQIERDRSEDGTYNIINQELSGNTRFTYIENAYSLVSKIRTKLQRSFLPKFNSFTDNFNGMGITIHDIHATTISLTSLNVAGNYWYADINYRAQDHFGLDDADIKNKKFRQFQFFKIWFLLQRYERFAYRPFMTNMNATVRFKGYVE